MNCGIPVAKDTYWVGVNDRQTDLFESIWPLPRGVSYTAYLVADEKVALIDTVKSCYEADLIGKIQGILGKDRGVDYLIVNHMEPDHSGAIKVLKGVFPQMKIVGNAQTKEFLKSFYAVDDSDILVFKDGEGLDLGTHKLSFHLIPMVHWPETMATFDWATGVAFTCDAFGGFGTLDGGIFDDEVDMGYYEGEILRYFSNIVGRYAPQVGKAIEKLKGLDYKIIAPSHGPIHRKNPNYIVEQYARWSRHETDCGAVIAFGSMYGNTQKVAEQVARALSAQGIEHIVLHDTSRSHPSFIVRDIWRYSGLVLAACTYNMILFPPVQTLVEHLKNKIMKNRILGVCASYSWSKGVALKALRELAASGGWELLEPQVEVKSSPTPEDLKLCDQLGKNLAQRLKACQSAAG